MVERRENKDVYEGDFIQELGDEKLSPRGMASVRGVDDTSTAESVPSDDAQQVKEATNRLMAIDEIKPETWQELEDPERLDTLQQVENEMAGVQGRPSVEVVADEMSRGSFGYFDGASIHVGAEALQDENVAENVDTIVHEGRHAYQQYAVDHPGFHSDHEQVQAWDENFDNYLTAEMYGQEAYQNQPVEADAWNYASQIRQAVYGEGE